MTAEIVVRNREAVILAADSAVSSRVGSIIKTSTSANKIFVLSNNHPVGIMIMVMIVLWDYLGKP